MKYARIKNNRVVDIATDPTSQFHPDLAVEFVEVPEQVGRGWLLGEDGSWTAPPERGPKPETKPKPPKVSAIEFKLLWTPTERVALNKLRETDDLLADFWALIEDPRLTQVDLNLASTKQAVTYAVEKLVEVEEISEDSKESRKKEVLSGKLQ